MPLIVVLLSAAKKCIEMRDALSGKMLFPLLSNISINTQVIIKNWALSLARYLGLSADNHLDGQNGRQ